MGAEESDAYLENGTLIDVRSKDEWDDGHIDGAILIPNYEIKDKIGQYVKDKNAPINLYCASGMRASSAKEELLSMGYTNVSNLGGYSQAVSVMSNK